MSAVVLNAKSWAELQGVHADLVAVVSRGKGLALGDTLDRIGVVLSEPYRPTRLVLSPMGPPPLQHPLPQAL